MGSILPIGDVVLLIIGIYVTKLRPFNVCELGMMVFESLPTLPYFIIPNSSFHGCRIPIKVRLKNSGIKKQI